MSSYKPRRTRLTGKFAQGWHETFSLPIIQATSQKGKLAGQRDPATEQDHTRAPGATHIIRAGDIERVWPETREKKGPVPDKIVGGVLEHCSEQLSSVFSEKINYYYLSREPPTHPQLKALDRSPWLPRLFDLFNKGSNTHNDITTPTWSTSVHLSTWENKKTMPSIHFIQIPINNHFSTLFIWIWRLSWTHAQIIFSGFSSALNTISPSFLAGRLKARSVHSLVCNTFWPDVLSEFGLDTRSDTSTVSVSTCTASVRYTDDTALVCLPYLKVTKITLVPVLQAKE